MLDQGHPLDTGHIVQWKFRYCLTIEQGNYKIFVLMLGILLFSLLHSKLENECRNQLQVDKGQWC